MPPSEGGERSQKTGNTARADWAFPPNKLTCEAPLQGGAANAAASEEC